MQYVRQVTRYGFALIGVSFVILAFAQDNTVRVWDAESIARLNTASTTLRDGSNGQVSGTVDVDTVRRLVEIKDKIAAVASQPARLFVASGVAPNAFASRRDGIPVIAVNLAMIKLFDRDFDAYAAVIGHEIAHLTLNHGELRLQREGLRTIAGSLLGLVLGKYGVPMSGTIADLSTTIVSRSFSREEESDADKLGVTYMRNAGYDPRGAVRAWEKMTLTAQQTGGLAFLSTHPAPQDRLAEMKRLADQGPVVAGTALAGVTKPTIASAVARPVVEHQTQPTEALTARVAPSRPTISAKVKSKALLGAEDAVSNDPEDAAAWYRLGAAHLDDKDFDKASRCFDEALRIDPNFAEALYGLGTIYYAKGELAKTKDLYPRIRNSNPEIAKIYFLSYLLP